MENKLRLTIQIKEQDNVAVAVHDLPKGTKTESGVVTLDAIPQAAGSTSICSTCPKAPA